MRLPLYTLIIAFIITVPDEMQAEELVVEITGNPHEIELGYTIDVTGATLAIDGVHTRPMRYCWGQYSDASHIILGCISDDPQTPPYSDCPTFRVELVDNPIATNVAFEIDQPSEWDVLDDGCALLQFQRLILVGGICDLVDYGSLEIYYPLILTLLHDGITPSSETAWGQVKRMFR